MQKFRNWFTGSPLVALGTTFLIGLAVAVAVLVFFTTGTPTTITMASGPEGSSFAKYAERYKKILAKDGITLKIVASEGSLDNLHKLLDPKSKVDVGFVLGGDSGAVGSDALDKLASLGSLSYQPVWVFYRGAHKDLLGDFKGKRLDIGEPGSGSHQLALALLKVNGIEPGGNTTLIESDPAKAVKSLLDGRVDVVFFMSDSASREELRKLMEAPDVHIFDFTQADAYVRQINYLNKLALPKGSLDLGHDIPSEDTHLVGPMVELIARDGLHPALSDSLIEAAKEVHGAAGLLKKRGEFPAPIEHEFHVSADAQRYYTSGKSWLYRTFPFPIARFINRIAIAVVPVILVLIPGLKIIPGLYRWRMQARIYRWYRELLDVEREALEGPVDAATRAHCLQELSEIEEAVKQIKVPATFADLFYSLREHIVFVRNLLTTQAVTALTVDMSELR
ncbi:MAG: C4-dicarboxylate ABC transporter substrate-binding protein [Burkholderiaceae bacterium]|nr:C4-dicarboxylate ABC transporter substrate-binding protein [Burkholderiaceae bacterium]